MIRYSKILILSLLTSICTFLWVQTSYAEDYRWTHYGIRPLAMGNAYVAVADDFNALFYNPAGLDRLEEWDGEFLSPTFTISAATTSFIGDLMSIASGGADSTSAVLELLKGQTGKVHHGGLMWTPHLIFPGFGFGLGVDLSTLLVTHSDIDIELDAGSRVLAPFSFATNFLEERLSVGFGVKLAFTAAVDQAFNIETLSAFSAEAQGTSSSNEEKTSINDSFAVGYGLGMDFGILFTPIDTMSPTLGISITDIGGTPFTAASADAAAPPIRLPSVNTGVSIKPYEEDGMYLMVAADAHSINQPHHYSHKLNLGLEYGLGDLLKLQTGMKAGYLTGGFQFDVNLLNVRFATYVEDHGSVVGLHPDLVDRRYIFSFKLLI